jgi:type IX secretion system substrate protein
VKSGFETFEFKVILLFYNKIALLLIVELYEKMKNFYKFLFTFFLVSSNIYFSFGQSVQWEHFYQRRQEVIFTEDSNFLWFTEAPCYLMRFNKISHQFTEIKLPAGLTNTNGYLGPIIHDNYGNIWLTTSQCVYKFDGTTFIHYPSVCGGFNFCDSLNNLWMRYYNHINIFDGTSFTGSITCPYGNLPWELRRDNAGNIWTSVDDTGIVKYDGTSWTSWDTSQIHSKYPLYRFAAPDHQGNIYAIPAVDGDSGYAVFDGMQWTHIDSIPGYKFHSNTTILSLDFDNNNNPVFGTTTGIVRNVNGIFQNDTFNIPYFALWALNYEPDGTIWSATREYILHYYEGNWEIYKTPNAAIAGDYFTCIAKDDSGSVFIGGNGFYDYGISRYKNSEWKHFPEEFTYSYQIYCGGIAKDTGQIIWALQTGDNELIKLDGDSFTFYTPTINGSLSALAIDANHYKVVGFNQDGICIFNNLSWNNISAGMSNNNVHSIAIDSLNHYWAGTEDGINIYNGTTWSYLNTSNSPLPSDMVYGITISTDGIKWISTDSGAAKYDGVNWTIYNTGNSALPSNTINRIYIDKYHVIWFCTDSGLVSFNGNLWKIYDSNNYPLLDNDVKDVLLDNEDNLWIVTSIGVNKVSHFYSSPYNSIEGSVFYDVNQNGIKDGTEPLMNNQMIQISPLNNISFSSTNGNFKFYVDSGNYTIQYLPNTNWILTTDSTSYTLHVDSTNLCCYEFGTAPTTFYDDLEVHLTGAAPHCGFQVPYWINYKNTGTTILDGIVWFLPDTALNVASTTPTASYTNGDTLFWNFNNLQPFDESMIQLIVDVPLVVQQLCSYTAANLSSGILMDADSLCDFIGCSCDPNDKSVRPQGVLAQHLTLKTDTLEYTINFQNIGTDTAFTVVIVDTLSSLFNFSTFEVIGHSHPLIYDISPQGIVTFRFENINLIYASMSEPGSHGFVKYRIRANASIPDSSFASNNAYIFFDFNPAIVTNTTFNTFVTTINLSYNELQHQIFDGILFPNPASSEFQISNFKFKTGDEITIVNVLGAILFRKKITLPVSSLKFQVSNFSNGIYFLKVKTKEGVLNKKVVVQH